MCDIPHLPHLKFAINFSKTPGQPQSLLIISFSDQVEPYKFYNRQGQLLAGFPGLRPDLELPRIAACLVLMHVKNWEGIAVGQGDTGQRTEAGDVSPPNPPAHLI